MITIKTIYRDITIERLNILVVLTFTVLIMAYFFIINNISMVNYKKTTLQRHIESLRTEIKILNLELSEKRSIGFLKKAIQGLNLVVNENIQYIKITGSVAKNQ